MGNIWPSLSLITCLNSLFSLSLLSFFSLHLSVSGFFDVGDARQQTSPINQSCTVITHGNYCNGPSNKKIVFANGSLTMVAGQGKINQSSSLIL